MQRQAWLTTVALRCCAWSERFFPDAYIFAALGVILVAVWATLASGSVLPVVTAFGDGFWSLIPFTLQMCFIIIGGYVVAASPTMAVAIEALARWPRSSRGAVACVALLSMLVALVHWGLSLVFGGLFVRALARRKDLSFDYRAGGAAAYLGLGAVWALGLSSSAAQLQANPASMPPALLAITGVIPFSQTIFLWQSILLTLILVVVSTSIAWFSAPTGAQIRSAADFGLDGREAHPVPASPPRPADALERSALISLLLVALGFGWLAREFISKGFAGAIANLNTYNFLFVMLGLLLNWRPRNFLDAVARSVPSTAGVLIQFPLYGAIASMLTNVKGHDGHSLAQHLAEICSHFATTNTFPLVMGVYSAILGFFVPSGGGKWLIEAPYWMQSANTLHAHLGWAVQVYNAAEALPNLINPFWMLPLLGVLRLKARDLIGFTFLQFLVNVPLVLLLLWLLGLTLHYQPPIVITPAH